MKVTFTGKIIAAEPFQQGTSQSGQPWASQSYVIEELNQQYPSRAVIQVFGSDKLQQFGIQVGEIITAHIGFKANQSRTNGRWFNQLDCWKVERPSAQPTQQGQQFQGNPQQQGQPLQPTVAPLNQQMQSFPPQVNQQGQPMGNQPLTNGQQQQGNLPF